MARTSLSDIRSLPDPLLGYNWDFFIPSMPIGDFRELTFKCQTVTLPGVQVEDVPVVLHGVGVKYAGREMFNHTFTTTILETRNMSTRTTVRNWIEYQRNAAANTGQYKVNYETTGQMVLYDDRGNAIRTVEIYGLFPQMLDEPSLDGQSSTPVTFTVTWNYDFHKDRR